MIPGPVSLDDGWCRPGDGHRTPLWADEVPLEELGPTRGRPEHRLHLRAALGAVGDLHRRVLAWAFTPKKFGIVDFGGSLRVLKATFFFGSGTQDFSTTWSSIVVRLRTAFHNKTITVWGERPRGPTRAFAERSLWPEGLQQVFEQQWPVRRWEIRSPKVWCFLSWQLFGLLILEHTWCDVHIFIFLWWESRLATQGNLFRRRTVGLFRVDRPLVLCSRHSQGSCRPARGGARPASRGCMKKLPGTSEERGRAPVRCWKCEW